MQLSVASTDRELAEVYCFRYRVYVEELGKEPRSADHQHKCIRDGLDPASLHLTCRSNGELIGVLRLSLLDRAELPAWLADGLRLHELRDWSPSELSHSSKLIVSQPHRNQDVATRLVQEMYRVVCDDGRRLHFVHCRPPLVPFYEYLGCQRYASEFVDDDGKACFPLVGLLRDREYLESIRSPLASPANVNASDPAAREWFAQRQSLPWRSRRSELSIAPSAPS